MMIPPQKFYEELASKGMDFFAGVPDSLLKDFCAYVSDHTPSERNIIAANEGNAIGLACGYHLATEKFGVVYLQNSGLGNAINPLTSLADGDVYSIPLLLIIGWRGEPGESDEPQHKKMGKITLPLLDAMHIPHQVLNDDYSSCISEAFSHLSKNKTPYAIVVRKNTFEKYSLKSIPRQSSELMREKALETILPSLREDDIVVSTTGMASRELFEARENRNEGHEKDFLTVGSMGHSSSIALSIALSKPDRRVFCIDGDGSMLMHLGSLAIISQLFPKNFYHILLNNYSHESVGAQPTAAREVSFEKLATACGYQGYLCASTPEQIKSSMESLVGANGPILFEIKLGVGHRKDLGRPTTTPIENKEVFMRFLQDGK